MWGFMTEWIAIDEPGLTEHQRELREWIKEAVADFHEYRGMYPNTVFLTPRQLRLMKVEFEKKSIRKGRSTAKIVGPEWYLEIEPTPFVEQTNKGVRVGLLDDVSMVRDREYKRERLASV